MNELSAESTASDGSSYQFLADGSRVYRIRVSVGDFLPEQLTVTCSRDTGQLLVNALVTGDSGSRDDQQRRRQMTRTFHVPPDVDTDRHSCTHSQYS